MWSGGSMERRAEKKSLLDEICELYVNPDGVDTAKLAEESLNHFKKSLLKK